MGNSFEQLLTETKTIRNNKKIQTHAIEPATY